MKEIADMQVSIKQGRMQLQTDTYEDINIYTRSVQETEGFKFVYDSGSQTCTLDQPAALASFENFLEMQILGTHPRLQTQKVRNRV